MGHSWVADCLHAEWRQQLFPHHAQHQICSLRYSGMHNVINRQTHTSHSVVIQC
jgi:hypothetical protein